MEIKNSPDWWKFQHPTLHDIHFDYAPLVNKFLGSNKNIKEYFQWYFDNRLKEDRLFLTFAPISHFQTRYHFIYTGLFNFLSRGIFLDYQEVKNLHSNHFHHWLNFIGHGLKPFWLLQEYIKGRGFNNPLGGIWKERPAKWIVHPGVTRLFVMDMAKTERIEILGHLPGRSTHKDHFIKKEFHSGEEIVEFFHKDNKEVHLAITTEFNTIIPHIHINSLSTEDSINKKFIEIKKFFDNHHLIANFDLMKYGYIRENREKKEVHLKCTTGNIIDEMYSIYSAPFRTNI